MNACSAMMQAIVRLPKPVIAAVQGVATAAGCQLVASCDLAVAADAARFATPGVNIGLFCSTPMVALSRNVPRKQAMEMLLTGEMISARDGADYRPRQPRGAAGTERDAAIALARQIAPKPPHARHRQGGVLSPGRDGPCRGLRLCREVMTENMMARDAEEGIGAFIDKREPKWQEK